jgi:protein gp37
MWRAVATAGLEHFKSSGVSVSAESVHQSELASETSTDAPSAMGKDSEIEWTHHTFNPWWGCTKVSAACTNCYAEVWAKRVGKAVWGANAPRRTFGEKHWLEPTLWNDEAQRLGLRYRVFCASMADVFEDRRDLDGERNKLWTLIDQTPHLDWLLLTKRPHSVKGMVPWKRKWPANVWIGTTVENQFWAARRLPHLLRLPAAVRFLSCEPLLGPLDLSKWVNKRGFRPIDWIIAGGESGPRSRPMRPAWLRNLRDYCADKTIAFHFKQWGHWIPEDQLPKAAPDVATLRTDPERMVALGKKIAGRVLDGKTYDSFPLASAA